MGLTGDLWLGLLVAPLVIGSLGLAVERTLIKPLYGGNLNDLLLLSFGLTSVIIEIVKRIWGRWGLRFYASDALEGWFNLGSIIFSKYLIALVLLLRPRAYWPKGACWSATHPPTADPRRGACPVSCCGPVYGAGGVEYLSPRHLPSGEAETRQRGNGVLDEARTDSYNGVLHVGRLHGEDFASAAYAAQVR